MRFSAPAAICAVMLTLLYIHAAAEPAVTMSEVAWHALPTIEKTPAPPAGRHTDVPALSESPSVDGRLGEGEWTEAAVANEWQRSDGVMPAPVQTTAYLGVCRERLYLGFRCEEPNVSEIRARVTEDGGRVWTDDDVEIFIDGNHDRDTFRQIIINSIGTVTAVDSTDEQWNPQIKRAARVGEEAWYVELSVPLDDIGISIQQIGLNLCRERYAGEGDVQLSCWNPTGGGFTVPEKFGTASVPGQYLLAFDPGECTPGMNEASIELQNPQQQPLQAQIVFRWRQGEEPWSELIGPGRTIAPEATKTVQLPYRIRRIGEPVVLRVSLLGNDTVIATHEIRRPVSGTAAMDLSQHIFLPDDRRLAARMTVDVSEQLAAESDLYLAVCSEPEGLPVFTKAVAPLRSGIATFSLTFEDLPPGRYSLGMALREHRDGIHRIAQETEDIRILPPVQWQ